MSLPRRPSPVCLSGATQVNRSLLTRPRCTRKCTRRTKQTSALEKPNRRLPVCGEGAPKELPLPSQNQAHLYIDRIVSFSKTTENPTHTTLLPSASGTFCGCRRCPRPQNQPATAYQKPPGKKPWLSKPPDMPPVHAFCPCRARRSVSPSALAHNLTALGGVSQPTIGLKRQNCNTPLGNPRSLAHGYRLAQTGKSCGNLPATVSLGTSSPSPVADTLDPTHRPAVPSAMLSPSPPVSFGRPPTCPLNRQYHTLSFPRDGRARWLRIASLIHIRIVYWHIMAS